MRTYTHVIDSKAVIKTMNVFPDHWVVRGLSERDYGIDLMIEIFELAGQNEHGHPEYDATGHVCYLQIKGTNTELHIKDDETISVQLSKKSLMYVEKFSTPFLLVRVCTLETSTSIYFAWIQRYILEVLDDEIPDWRNQDQESFTIHVPYSNKLPDALEKVEGIAARIKYVEEFAEYYERYVLMKDAYNLMINGDFSDEQYRLFIRELRRIQTLKTLLKLNNCQVGEEEIAAVIDYVKDLYRGQVSPNSIEDFPQPSLHNMELLLSDNFMRMSAEQMIAENEGTTVY